MAAKPDEATSSVGSGTPHAFVDLTVDSPVIQRRRRASVLRHGVSSAAAAAENYAVVVTENIDPDCSNRLLPPKKRARKDKALKADAVINLDDAADIDDVPTVNDSVSGESNVLSCPICLEDLTTKRKPTSTRCGHIYCAECIEQTLGTSKKCPKCQSGITQKSCIRLYF